MSDQWASQSTGINGPARNAASVTPSDGTDLPDTARALYIGGAGDVAVITVGGQTETFTVPAGLLLPLCIERVLATGTTATAIKAMW